MSSGVSDQMKVPGSTGKNLEQRNIPWSQQVDEASYENLASPAHDDSSGNNSSMQFQYPPFNAKESSNNPWNNYNNKPRKNSSNFDVTKKFGKPDFYNNSRRDDYQQQQQQHNAWGRKPNNDNNSAYNNIGQANRFDDSYATGKLDNKSSVSGMAIEHKKQNMTPAVAAPKKTTWASIASQPVKPTSKTTLTTSSHKKKGPGLPPPPMVPGKHNLDVNTWDLPNNNPPPVPSPPPPLDLSQIDANAEPILGPGSSMFRHDLSGRPDKSMKASSIDATRDENKSNYNNSNFGRVRNSPNGHSRKNWVTPTQQQQQSGQPSQTGRSIIGNSGAGSGLSNYTVRRGNNEQMPASTDAAAAGDRMMGNDTSGPANRYRKNERSFGAPRDDNIDNTKYNYRDENTPRNYEQQNVQVEEVSSESVLEELRTKNNYNPAELDLEKTKLARFFVIKSYSEDDIHRSIKYEIWCSTERGNRKLDEAFKERQSKGGNVLLFFSVNGSGHFCGMAEMITAVDYNSISNVWSQDKWKGKFKVKWIYVKDVPNNNFRHILLENNENKSVTNSRDAQEVPNAPGIEVLEILHIYRHKTSIFDDFYHYEKKQEQEVSYKRPSHYESINHTAASSPISRHYGRQTDERDRGGMGQKYHMNSAGSGGSGGGGGGGSISGGSVAGGFRERNNGMQRGGNIGGSGYYEHRRYDGHGHRNMDRDNGDNNGDRETGTGDNKYAQKFSNNRRLDDRNHTKMNNRDKERDFSQEKQSNEGRFRATAP